MTDSCCAEGCHVASASSYTSLDRHRKHIRLLRILPQTDDGNIYCSTISTALNSAPTYSALSYAWGPANSRQFINLNGSQLAVRKNLYNFLLQARKWPHDENRLFWIDALCIDQENNPERSHQVSLMAKIYSGADQVLVWLGLPSQDSNIAMRCVVSGESLRRTRDTFKTKAGSALVRLYSRSYWTRLWVLQELALARSVILICGDEQALWETEAAFPDIDGAPGATQESEHEDINGIRRTPAAAMFRLIHRSRGMATLYEQVILSKHLGCSELRDKVFALLGLPHTGGEDIQPDYGAQIFHILNNVLRGHYRVKPRYSWDDVEQQCKDLIDALKIDAHILRIDGDTRRPIRSKLRLSYEHIAVTPVRIHETSDTFWWIVVNDHWLPSAPSWSANQSQKDLEKKMKEAIRSGAVPIFSAILDVLVHKFPRGSWIKRWLPCSFMLDDLPPNKSLAKVFHHVELIESKQATSVSALLTAVRTDATLCKESGAHFLLHVAALWGKARTIDLLLDEDHIDVNAKDLFGRTALALAVTQNNSEIVKSLLKAGSINPNILVRGIQSVQVSYTNSKGRIRGLQIIEERDDNPDLPESAALHIAVELHRHYYLELLLSCATVDVNLKDGERNSVFDLICEGRNRETRSLLRTLFSRLDLAVNIRNDAGDNLLFQAFKRRASWPYIETLLTRQDIDKDATNAEGDSAFVFTCKNRDLQLHLPPDILSLHQGLGTNAEHTEFSSAFLLMCRSRKWYQLESLLSRCNLDIHMKAGVGDNLLHQALKHNVHALVRYLLFYKKSDINGDDRDGDTSLILSCRDERPWSTAERLSVRERCEELNIESSNESGDTALNPLIYQHAGSRAPKPNSHLTQSFSRRKQIATPFMIWARKLTDSWFIHDRPATDCEILSKLFSMTVETLWSGRDDQRPPQPVQMPLLYALDLRRFKNSIIAVTDLLPSVTGDIIETDNLAINSVCSIWDSMVETLEDICFEHPRHAKVWERRYHDSVLPDESQRKFTDPELHDLANCFLNGRRFKMPGTWFRPPPCRTGGYFCEISLVSRICRFELVRLKSTMLEYTIPVDPNKQRILEERRARYLESYEKILAPYVPPGYSAMND